jgi:single-strand DNA-binding protein
LAVNESYKSDDGNQVETVTFVEVNVWGRQAETVCEYLDKGSPALIEGRLELKQWEKDGQPQSRLMVRADRVQFLGSRSGGGNSNGNGGGYRSTANGNGNGSSHRGTVSARSGSQSDRRAVQSRVADNDGGDYPDDDIPF